MLVTLRDGIGYLQTVFTDALCHTHEAVSLSAESSIAVYGLIKTFPDDKRVQDKHQLLVDFWELIGTSPTDGIKLILAKGFSDVLLDNRHLLIRGENLSKIMKLRSVVTQCFRDHYIAQGYYEVTPPTCVLTRHDDIPTWFRINYFGEEVGRS
ncbi:Asparagine--tRNA ligase, cytoplasmic [Bulinus truncatus]|nr:Asparagine--tRNA ligase, cytoplasmic [Bulinus truncatus]